MMMAARRNLRNFTQPPATCQRTVTRDANVRRLAVRSSDAHAGFDLEVIGLCPPLKDTKNGAKGIRSYYGLDRHVGLERRESRGWRNLDPDSVPPNLLNTLFDLTGDPAAFSFVQPYPFGGEPATPLQKDNRREK